MAEAVKVVVRCRPMNKREMSLKCAVSVQVHEDIGKIELQKPVDGQITRLDTSKPAKAFTYDAVYGANAIQRSVFMDTGFPLVQSVLEGYNGTVFAYGQTGCGKSYSMQGVDDPPELRGIIPSAFQQIFDCIEEDKTRKFLVTAAYLELYQEQVRDLLGDDPKQQLDLKESKATGVFVQGLTHNIVRNIKDLEVLQKRGNRNRTVGFTNMNADSSRSHSIFIIKIETSQEGDTPNSKSHIRAGKLNLVDLAGSERQSKTGAAGTRLKEATKINLSLSALGNVISALVAGKGKHIPYRDSKLTRLLQDSLGGNTKTVMIACISPAADSYDETLSTLRYANRAKNIKNKPKINEDPKDTLLREYQQEIDRLKMMLQAQAKEAPPQAPTGGVELSLESGQVRVVEGGTEGLSQAEIEALRDEWQAQHEEKLRALENERKEAADLQQRLQEEWQKIKQIQAEHAKAAASRQGTKPPHTSDSTDDANESLTMAETDNRDDATLIAQQAQLELAMGVNQERNEALAAQIENAIEEMHQQDHLTSEEFEQLLQKKHEELEESKRQMEKERNDAQQRLESHQQQTEEERARMQEALKILEGQLLEGGKQVEDVKLQHEREMRQAEAAMLEHKRRENDLSLQKAKAEEEKLLLKENYDSLQEEVEGLREKTSYLQERLVVAETDASDLQQEFEREKSELLENLREADKEAILYKQIATILMSKLQLDTIVRGSKWNGGREKWDIPRVTRPAHFPKLVIHDDGSHDRIPQAPSSSRLETVRGAGKGRISSGEHPSRTQHKRSESKADILRRKKQEEKQRKQKMRENTQLQNQMRQNARQELKSQSLRDRKMPSTGGLTDNNERDDVLDALEKAGRIQQRASWKQGDVSKYDDITPPSQSAEDDMARLLGEVPEPAPRFKPAFVIPSGQKSEVSAKERALETIFASIPDRKAHFQPASFQHDEDEDKRTNEEAAESWLHRDIGSDREQFRPDTSLLGHSNVVESKMAMVSQAPKASFQPAFAKPKSSKEAVDDLIRRALEGAPQERIQRFEPNHDAVKLMQSSATDSPEKKGFDINSIDIKPDFKPSMSNDLDSSDFQGSGTYLIECLPSAGATFTPDTSLLAKSPENAQDITETLSNLPVATSRAMSPGSTFSTSLQNSNDHVSTTFSTSLRNSNDHVSTILNLPVAKSRAIEPPQELPHEDNAVFRDLLMKKGAFVPARTKEFDDDQEQVKLSMSDIPSKPAFAPAPALGLTELSPAMPALDVNIQARPRFGPADNMKSMSDDSVDLSKALQTPITRPKFDLKTMKRLQ